VTLELMGRIYEEWRRRRAPARHRPPAAINAQAAALAAAAKPRAADDERGQAKRSSLAGRLEVEAKAKALADLEIEMAAVERERRAVDADPGPVRYLATLLGQADEVVLRWFILVVAVLLDPAAVLCCWQRRGPETELPRSQQNEDFQMKFRAPARWLRRNKLHIPILWAVVITVAVLHVAVFFI
jgi:hypothetical protein